MGKPTGFLEYNRVVGPGESPKVRLEHFREFHLPLAESEQRRQGARCMDCGVPFCQWGGTLGGMGSGCPLHNLCPEWNDLLYHGNWKEAYLRLRKTNNFPEFTGRVCPALCEASCTCGVNTDPVTIKENERAIVEWAYQEGIAGPRIPAVRTGKSVAVVGSGPSGLAVGDLLNQRGHKVTIYEREDRPGGLLMYGIPNMKLEKEVVERRVRIMEQEGITFFNNTPVATKEKAQELLRTYDAVVLACGAGHPRDIPVKGREAKGIYFAVDYLKATTKALLSSPEKPRFTLSSKDKNVIVIGGGDTGNDCVGTAMRQGCKSILQLEMMPKPPVERLPGNSWPEWPRILKTDYGQEEAAAIFGQDPRRYETTVEEFHKDSKGDVKSAVLVKLTWKKDKKTGRMIPVQDPKTREEVPAERVFIAAGFLGPEGNVPEAFQVEVDGRSNVKTAPGRHETNVEKVFTAGDMHLGQSLVVRAIQEGREAARAVDAYLMGYSGLDQ